MEERLWVNWREILREDYEFKRKEKELEALDKINLKEFQSWVKNYLKDKSRRYIVVLTGAKESSSDKQLKNFTHNSLK